MYINDQKPLRPSLLETYITTMQSNSVQITCWQPLCIKTPQNVAALDRLKQWTYTPLWPQ